MKKSKNFFKGFAAEKLFKVFLIVVAAVIVLSAAAVGVLFILKNQKSGGDIDDNFQPPAVTKSQKLYPADFNENIFENDAYMLLNRDMVFGDDTVKYTLNDENCAEYGEYAVFFKQYFNTVISGDNDKYKTFFTQSYFDKISPIKKFTMQMIYRIEVLFHSEAYEDVDGVSTLVRNYYVSYQILRNNGTFRDNTAPQVYKVINTSDGLKISSILDIEYK